MNETIGSFHFHSDFDSGNLAKVVINEKNDNEFHLWTLPDCANTPYENGNRTWFYFGVKGPCNTTVKFNIMNLNRQAKLYSQGMKPLYKVLPHQEQWERIKDKPLCSMEDQSFVLSFKFTMPLEENSTVYFAFCYPYSYSDLLCDLDALDARFSAREGNIYFGRELLCNSLEQRRVDLVTVTRNGDENRRDKPVVFVSARVHPGETPSSFVLKGFMDFILKEDDIRAQKLRENFIFLLVPMLNPDGVYRGHYRTDSRGVNLNRVYLETNAEVHPTIAATKQLLIDLAKEDLVMETNSMCKLEQQVKDALTVETDDSNCRDTSDTLWPLSFKNDGGRTNFAGLQFPNTSEGAAVSMSSSTILSGSTLEGAEEGDVSAQYFDVAPATSPCPAAVPSSKSRLFAYIDLHGHASKRGIFIYGNHFKDANQQVECLLLPKLISLNSQHFDFWACNFSEKNMRQRDKRDGLSKEGSGRVSISKLTGIPRSYTLECNYNTGRMRNILSPLPTDKFPLFHATSADAKDDERLEGSTISRRRTVSAGPSLTDAFAPPVPYAEQSFQEVGEAMAVSLLDLIGANPMSRLPQSTYGDVEGARQWIRLHCLGQRRFPFVEADADEESAGSHLPSSVATTNSLQQVSQRDSLALATTSTPTTGDLASTVMSHLPAKRLSPGKRLPKSRDKTNRVRVRKPWPGSPRMKESPNQSPKQQGPSPVDFAPSSPSYQHFPKQVKSPPSARRVPRKKSLRKTKVQPVVKKDGVVDVELNATPHATSPASPPKQLLKRKRRKSRTISLSESCKEKRKFKGSPVAVAAVAAAVVAASDNNHPTDVDYSQPSTSASTRSQTKSVLVKKKKLLKKRNATSVLQKKKRITLITE